MTERSLRQPRRGAQGRALPLWALPGALSLDAVFVALAWHALFARGFGVALEPLDALVLSLSVWLVYTADRLLDARRLELERPHSLRHGFAQRAFRGLAGVWLLLLGLDALLAFRVLSPAQLGLGAGLLALTLAYGFGLHGARRARRYSKELQVGLVFAFGSSVSVWAAASSLRLLAATLLFAALCSSNLLLIAVAERDLDAAQGQPSLARAWPGLARALPWVLALVGLLALALARTLPLGFALACALAALLLAGLAALEPRLPVEALRALADLALLTPLLFLGL